MQRLSASILMMTLVASAAQASGGLNCEASDKSSTLSVGAGISRGMGSNFFNFRGTLELRGAGIPQDFRRLDLKDDDLTQRWLDGRNLKLRIYRERIGEPHGYVDVTVEAWSRKNDEFEYRGGYVVTIFDAPKSGGDARTLTLQGRATCSAE